MQVSAILPSVTGVGRTPETGRGSADLGTSGLGMELSVDSGKAGTDSDSESGKEDEVGVIPNSVILSESPSENVSFVS